MEKEKGITLITLVVTIVVLLIMAGVTLYMVLRDNGIVARAKEARKNYKNAQIQEEIDLTNLEVNIEQSQREKPNKIGVDQVATKNSTMNGEYASYKNPVIPKGFKAINVGNAMWGDGTQEVMWEEGLVIADATEDEVTKESQFVWIPVSDFNEFKPIEGYNDGVLQNRLSNYRNEKVTEEANYIYESVKYYGGFYIARFEAGVYGTESEAIEPTLNPADGTVKPVSKKAVNVWNSIPFGGGLIDIKATDGYQGDDREDGPVKLARSMYPDIEKIGNGNPYQLPVNLKNDTSAISTLVYGVLWDSVVRFLANIENEQVNAKYIQDSSNMGNYAKILEDGTTEIGNTIKKTGQFEVKNIYDMARQCL